MKMYPKKFVEWLLHHAEIDVDTYDYETKWAIETETHVVDYLTTKEAYKYWKANKKSYK